MNTWEMVLPPSRPDKWQLDIIKTIIACRYGPLKIAVLGATVEFRDLLATYRNIDVYVFEKNEAYFSKTNKSRVYNNRENIIWGDWRETIRKYIDYFDIVLSDLTSGNIPYENRLNFYKDISASLIESGLFVDRILTKPIPFIELDELLKKYSRLSPNLLNVNHFNNEVLFCSTLLNNESSLIETNIFYDKLLGLHDPIITKFVDFCYRITPRNCIWWYSIDWEIEVENYNKFLCLIDCWDEPTSSPYFNRSKLIASKKKL